jgi:hypothetical protein
MLQFLRGGLRVVGQITDCYAPRGRGTLPALREGMTTATKAEIVQTVDGVTIVTTVAIENLEAACAVRGWKVCGTKRSRNIKIRPELEGAPMFSGLVGPMYGGEGVVRYEDSATHARMSA